MKQQAPKQASRKQHVVQEKRIIISGGDIYGQHREDFETCPHLCGYKMAADRWEERAIILVLEPRCYRAGYASIVSECPKCFQNSWVHIRFQMLAWGNKFPAEWGEVGEKQSNANKLHALREWGKGLCHRCAHLESGTVDHHAWRHCIKGSGPPETECGRFDQV